MPLAMIDYMISLKPILSWVLRLILSTVFLKNLFPEGNRFNPTTGKSETNVPGISDRFVLPARAFSHGLTAFV
jgi:hypothetical protein